MWSAERHSRLRRGIIAVEGLFYGIARKPGPVSQRMMEELTRIQARKVVEKNFLTFGLGWSEIVSES